MATEDQDQIVELQTKVAFLEQTIDELNEILTQQQAQISLMERAMKHLNTQIEQLAGPNIKAADEESPPPHY